MCCKEYPKLFCPPKNKRAIDYINDWIDSANVLLQEYGNDLLALQAWKDEIDKTLDLDLVNQTIADVASLKTLDFSSIGTLDVAKLANVLNQFVFDIDDTILYANINPGTLPTDPDDPSITLQPKSVAIIDEDGYLRIGPDFTGETNKYFSANGTWEVVPQCHCNESNIQEITYNDLVDLVDTNGLIPGKEYKIIDYQTNILDDWNTTSKHHQFDIIVKATSINTLDENVHFSLHQDDLYFADANIDSWEGKYCLKNDFKRFGFLNIAGDFIYIFDSDSSVGGFDYGEQVLFRYPQKDDVFNNEQFYAWVLLSSQINRSSLNIYDDLSIPLLNIDENIDESDIERIFFTRTSTPNQNDSLFVYNGYLINQDYIKGYYPKSKGAIYYLKDDRGNEACYDFKNIYYKHTLLVNNKEIDVEGYTFCNSDKNDATLDYGVQCYNNVIKGKTDTFYFIPNDIEYNRLILNKIVLCGDSIYSNFFDEGCLFIFANGDFYENEFGKNCESDYFGQKTNNNKFGANYNNNYITYWFHDSMFDDNAQNNTFETNPDLETTTSLISGLTTGKDFQNNTISVPKIFDTTIGDRFKNNTIEGTVGTYTEGSTTISGKYIMDNLHNIVNTRIGHNVQQNRIRGINESTIGNNFRENNTTIVDKTTIEDNVKRSTITDIHNSVIDGNNTNLNLIHRVDGLIVENGVDYVKTEGTVKNTVVENGVKGTIENNAIIPSNISNDKVTVSSTNSKDIPTSDADRVLLNSNGDEILTLSDNGDLWINGTITADGLTPFENPSEIGIVKDSEEMGPYYYGDYNLVHYLGDTTENYRYGSTWEKYLYGFRCKIDPTSNLDSEFIIYEQEFIVEDNDTYRHNKEILDQYPNTSKIVATAVQGDNVHWEIKYYNENDILIYTDVLNDNMLYTAGYYFPFTPLNAEDYDEGSIDIVIYVEKIYALKEVNPLEDDKYLPLTGGTLSGIVNTENLAPNEADRYIIGTEDGRYKAGYFKEIYADNIKANSIDISDLTLEGLTLDTYKTDLTIGDGLVITDGEDNNSIKSSTVLKFTNNTTNFLRQDGVFAVPTFTINSVNDIAKESRDEGKTVIFNGTDNVFKSGVVYTCVNSKDKYQIIIKGANFTTRPTNNLIFSRDRLNAENLLLQEVGTFGLGSITTIIGNDGYITLMFSENLGGWYIKDKRNLGVIPSSSLSETTESLLNQLVTSNETYNVDTIEANVEVTISKLIWVPLNEIQFDGHSTNKYLSQAGTWESIIGPDSYIETEIQELYAISDTKQNIEDIDITISDNPLYESDFSDLDNRVFGTQSFNTNATYIDINGLTHNIKCTIHTSQYDNVYLLYFYFAIYNVNTGNIEPYTFIRFSFDYGSNYTFNKLLFGLIDDNNEETFTTYSSAKIIELKEEIDSEISDIYTTLTDDYYTKSEIDELHPKLKMTINSGKIIKLPSDIENVEEYWDYSFNFDNIEVRDSQKPVLLMFATDMNYNRLTVDCELTHIATYTYVLEDSLAEETQVIKPLVDVKIYGSSRPDLTPVILKCLKRTRTAQQTWEGIKWTAVTVEADANTYYDAEYNFVL